MKTLTSIAGMRAACRGLRAQSGSRLGFVPTMGALHDGHLSLVRKAREQCDHVAVSIFVNPRQFGPNEDLDAYPHTPERDADMLRDSGVDLLFLPAAAEMYHPDFSTTLTVEGLSGRLCGASRPGHFSGVTTVVAKLLNIVQPDQAFFGQKDAAQAAIIRKMAADLSFPVEITLGAIVREPDGLAMSSRNAYLNPEQREQARVLSRCLQEVDLLVAAGVADSARLIDAARQTLALEPGVQVEYVAIVDPDTLLPVDDVSRRTLVAVAARVGTTRLIDNVLVKG